MFFANNGILAISGIDSEKLERFASQAFKLITNGEKKEENFLGYCTLPSESPFSQYVTIEIEDVYGDIEDDLNQICVQAAAEGILVNGTIEYFGDADGRYEIINNRMISETESFLRDLSTDALLSELKRRNTERIINAVKELLRDYSAQYITVTVNEEMGSSTVIYCPDEKSFPIVCGVDPTESGIKEIDFELLEERLSALGVGGVRHV